MSAVRSACQLLPCIDVNEGDYDGVVIVTDCSSKLTGNLQALQEPLEQYKQIDASFGKDVSILYLPSLPSKRLIFSPTGPLNRDQDDVRRFADAAIKGVKRALSAGCKAPILVRPIDDTFQYAGPVATLGALHSLYVPLEVREGCPDRAAKVSKMAVWCNDLNRVTTSLKWIEALESGRFVARDIGGSDPERMAAPRVAEYITDLFKDTSVKVDVWSGQDVFEREYPLLAAVNRCAAGVTRHQGRVVHLEYEGEGPINQTLFFVGKGITYDTGGADIKAGGVMAGMHRDKCGAAAVAGFFQVLAASKPRGIKCVGVLAMVRNSVGSDCYVADEIITSRAGVRVRVGNTDAEGRMVMSDLLCHMKEKAIGQPNPQIFTIATLTGHAIRAMGDKYSIVMDNGPARLNGTAQQIQTAGHAMGDPFEISTIRREDYEFCAAPSEYEDVLQCNNAPSTMTARGHQFPAAFMIVSSGLDKHGVDSEKPLKYSHMDIAGSSGPFPGVPTGAPIVALATNYLKDRLN
ncbi:unnamed protein product [Owenia fusiformis]|uniref:Uncharacterized protein n=1 Tax=Owenia fusiformis TaxID=6347 RepID=A0A8J1XGL7_OWEFU|nr:unnamed protein product [Owenia fusiformis]